jgi:hypothetical protein
VGAGQKRGWFGEIGSTENGFCPHDNHTAALEVRLSPAKARSPWALGRPRRLAENPHADVNGGAKGTGIEPSLIENQMVRANARHTTNVLCIQHEGPDRFAARAEIHLAASSRLSHRHAMACSWEIGTRTRTQYADPPKWRGPSDYMRIASFGRRNWAGIACDWVYN